MREKSVIRSFIYAALAATGLVASAGAQQPAAAPDPASDAAATKPAVERLEDGRYRIGPIWSTSKPGPRRPGDSGVFLVGR